MSASHGYDADLASAVKLDKRTIQEGYNTDLLDKPAASPVPAPPPQRNTTADSYQRSHNLEAQSPIKPRKTPFYRTKKGLIIIGALLVVVIIAAVVGGVVGGKKNKGDQQILPGGSQQEAENGGEQPTGDQTTVAPAVQPPVASALGSALSGLTNPTAPSQPAASPTVAPAPQPPVNPGGESQPGNPGNGGGTDEQSAGAGGPIDANLLAVLLQG